MYVPRVEAALRARSREIRSCYHAGETVDDLAGDYCLSPERVRAILRDR